MEKVVFRLEIELGSEEMRFNDHIAEALRIVATKVGCGFLKGKIKDANGNTVGKYEMETEKTK